MEWKRVNKKNYDSFENEMTLYRYRSAEDLLVESNGALTVWDDQYSRYWDLRFGNTTQDALDERSNRIVGAFYAV
jgi:hypothetical protein